MRRWMSIITLATLVLALAAGWGIGQLAGGGSDDESSFVRAIPTLGPTGTPAAEPTPTDAPASTTATAPEGTPTTAATEPAASTPTAPAVSPPASSDLP